MDVPLCEYQDGHFHECGQPAAGVCLDSGLALCARHLARCGLVWGHRTRECPGWLGYMDGGGI